MTQQSLRVAVCGDYCAREREDVFDAAHAKAALAPMRPILDSADLRLINLENPILERGTAIAKSGPALKGKPETLALLEVGRFECAILANNHVGDYGAEGVLSTLKHLDARAIGHVGAGRNLEESYKPWYRDTEAGVLAVVAVCENEFGGAGEDAPGSAGFRPLRVLRAIREAKRNADFVLVVMHGGNEHNPLPSPRAAERYRGFIEYGADAVIGMHPHCIQGYETYNGAPILYSTGNFLFSNSSVPDPRHFWYYGVVPVLTFAKGAPAAMELHPYRFDPACTAVTPLDGAERGAMLDYLEKISAPIGNAQALARYFKGWCMIGGIPYAGHLRYDPEYLKETEFPTGHPLIPLRNLFTCEAHNELLTTLFRLIAEGEVPLARDMEKEVRALQTMPV